MNEREGSVEDDERDESDESSEREEALEDDEQEGPHDEHPPSRNTLHTRAPWEHLAWRGLTEEERRIAVQMVRRVWRQWRHAIPGGSAEDMEVEAALEVHQARDAVAARSPEEGQRLLALRIYRRLRKAVDQEFRQRGRAPVRNAAILADDRDPALADERADLGEALASDTLLAEVSDEQILAALRALPPLDQRILDLSLIQGLTHPDIALRLNEAPEELPKQRKLTARAVESRYERAIKQLRALLGADKAE